MSKGRLEAFSDAVIAIVLTIMVLELQAPLGADLAALRPLLPKFLSYVLSFVYLGLYWNNHHHLMQAAEQVNGSVLLANLHLLFWLSLIPFVTGWMGENHFSAMPLALYGSVLWMSGLAYYILVHTLIKHHGKDSVLAAAIGRDEKGIRSMYLYTAGIVLAFVLPWISAALYVAVAVMWLIPDRRIENKLSEPDPMHKFVAFLRAINVGGTRIIKMDSLKGIFESMPLQNVNTFIQSGNVIFESREASGDTLETRIEAHLEKTLRYKVETFVRPMAEIVKLANQKMFQLKDNDTLHIVFLRAKPDRRTEQAILSNNSAADEFAVNGREVYNLRHDRDRSVFTNNFMEKILKAPATTRNWNTICKIAEKYG